MLSIYLCVYLYTMSPQIPHISIRNFVWWTIRFQVHIWANISTISEVIHMTNNLATYILKIYFMHTENHERGTFRNKNNIEYMRFG